jgi:hypothetical protein
MNILIGAIEIKEAGTYFFGPLKKCTNYTFDPLYTYKVYFVYFIHEEIGCDGDGERNWESGPAFHLENPEEKPCCNGKASEAI